MCKKEVVIEHSSLLLSLLTSSNDIPIFIYGYQKPEDLLFYIKSSFSDTKQDGEGFKINTCYYVLLRLGLSPSFPTVR